MREFVETSGRFVAADASMQSIRSAYDALCRHFTPRRDTYVEIEDRSFADDAGRHIPIRVYRPVGEAPRQGWPCVLYLHGGGWMLGGLDSHEFLTARLARDVSAVVIAVDYRLAPEAAFPAAFDDCLAAWRHLQEKGGGRYGIDTSRVAVAGDSSGGNLAAALCVEIAKLGDAAPRGQALIYPVLCADASLPSYRDHADAPLLSAADIADCLRAYAPDPASHRDPRLAPLEASSFDGLPPAFVAVAEFDPLCDDGRIYVERLRAADVPAQFHLGRGLLHGSMRALDRCPETARLYRAFADAIAQMLRNTP